MCVVFVANKGRPTEEETGKAWAANNHGGGVAWIEEGEVHWSKGMSEDEMQEACQTLPLPYIAHWRIATVGGVQPVLTHPFPLDPDVPNLLIGKSKNGVLMHNGHWGKWEDFTLRLAIEGGHKIPPGVWSDSRAMAFCAAILGEGILDFIGEKAVVLTPTGIRLYGGMNSWYRHDGRFLASNDHWKHRVWRQVEGKPDTTIYTPAPKVSAPGGNAPLDELPFRGDRRDAGATGNHQKPVQGTQGTPQQKGESSEGHPQEGAGVALGSPDRELNEALKDAPMITGADALKWVRSLNPRKLLKGDHELEKRLVDAAEGKLRIGPM